MKPRLILLAVSLAVLVAQTAQQKDQDKQQQTKQTDSQTNTKSGTDSQMKSGTQSNAGSAEMKTMTYKGILVDMSCASQSSSAAAPSGSEAAPAGDAGKPSQEKANSANRSAADSGSNCAVTANSTDLGLKMDDGKTVRFDLVGNQRAQDELKNNKGWNKDLTAGKPIHAKVSGVMSGEKLIVTSIH